MVRPKRKKEKAKESGDQAAGQPPSAPPAQEEAKGAPEVLEVSAAHAAGPASLQYHGGPKSLTGGTRV